MTKAARAALVAAALAAAVGLGRLWRPRSECEDRATLDSFRQALEERDWLSRSYRFTGFLQRLGPEELPGALEALERRRAWLEQDELRAFMLAWTRFDAPAAFRRALSWPGRSQRAAAGAALYAWAFRDPEAATRALASVEDAQLRDYLRTRLVAGWVRSGDEDSANRYIASLPAGAQRESFVGMLARELNEQGAEAVMRWAESVPEVVPSYKKSVFRKACAALTATDPEAAVRWAAAHAGRDYAAGSTAIIAGRWADLDPRAALAWVVTQPDDAERDAAIADAFAEWLRLARGDAETWLRSATPSASLDPAVRVAVRRVNEEGSPAGAVAWARRIADDRLREEVSVAVGRAWLRRDPSAARLWLAGSDLPEATRAAIREPQGRAGEGEDEAAGAGLRSAAERARGQREEAGPSQEPLESRSEAR